MFGRQLKATPGSALLFSDYLAILHWPLESRWPLGRSFLKVTSNLLSKLIYKFWGPSTVRKTFVSHGKEFHCSHQILYYLPIGKANSNPCDVGAQMILLLRKVLFCNRLVTSRTFCKLLLVARGRSLQLWLFPRQLVFTSGKSSSWVVKSPKAGIGKKITKCLASFQFDIHKRYILCLRDLLRSVLRKFPQMKGNVDCLRTFSQFYCWTKNIC